MKWKLGGKNLLQQIFRAISVLLDEGSWWEFNFSYLTTYHSKLKKIYVFIRLHLTQLD